jgi:hypothetical protein
MGPGSPKATGSGGQESVTSNEEARRRQIERQRSGFLKTIRTSPGGITGQGPDLKASGLYGRETLG